MSRILVVGSGLVGSAFARLARDSGDHVTGTTTTPDRVETLGDTFDEVLVLRGSDTEAVRSAGSGCDAVVVTAGPSAAQAMSRDDRMATYHDVLVKTAESVTGIAGNPHLVMLSSLSVYGHAADHLEVIDESAPTTDSDDPSPANFLAAEQTYLERAGGRSTVLRCADIYGDADPPIEAKVKMAHDLLGGSVPFGGEALFYRVDVGDVARAIHFALQNHLTGVFNLTHPEVPATNRELFDAIGAQQGHPPLEFRDEIAAPTRPIDTARLRAAGFDTSATAPTQVT